MTDTTTAPWSPEREAQIRNLGNDEHRTVLTMDNALDDTLAELDRVRAELDRVRAKTLREAARVLEDTGRDDDAVNLLDNLADAAERGDTQ